MGMKLSQDKMLKAEETMSHFPKGDIFGASPAAKRAMSNAASVGPNVSPTTPRSSFSIK